MAVQDISCLKTVFKNINPDGRRIFFSFLPPHGRALDYGDEFSAFGTPDQVVARMDRVESKKHIAGLERALQRGDLAIIQTPNVIVTDDANPGAAPQMLRLHNGTLGVTDPCWQHETSLSQELG